MKIFGIRILRNSTYENRLTSAEKAGSREAKRNLIYRTRQDLIRKYDKAPVVITGVKLTNPPEHGVYRDGGLIFYGYKEFTGAKYKVKFRLNGTNDEVSIDLEFDDYDVSISDLQRAIQAKICGKEGGCNNDGYCGDM